MAVGHSFYHYPPVDGKSVIIVIRLTYIVLFMVSLKRPILDYDYNSSVPIRICMYV